jgi:hypothetical protein
MSDPASTPSAPAPAAGGAGAGGAGAPAPAAAVLPGTAALCRGCRAPLAPDQRYCLSCGLRVADARVAFVDLLVRDAGGAGSAAAGSGAAGSARGGLARQLDRVGGPMGAAAVVLVALGIGFLLGQGGNGGPATVIQRPPVVNVQNGGAAAAGAATTPSSGAGSGSATTTPRGGSKSSSGSAGTKGIPTAPAQDNSGGDINKLKSQPPDQATPGAPPPKDHKAAGGGSPVTSIG